jgi:hypothetical protein
MSPLSIGWRGLADQAAKIDEVFVRGRPLGEFYIGPHLNELFRGHSRIF